MNDRKERIVDFKKEYLGPEMTFEHFEKETLIRIVYWYYCIKDYTERLKRRCDKQAEDPTQEEDLQRASPRIST